MILVFVTNERFGEVANLSFNGRVSYRNPRYLKPYDKAEKCEGVYIHGNFPKVEALYKDKLVKPIEQFPKRGSAGWYELSDGSKVRGEEEAIKAQKEL